ncbi:hypothetical protein [Janthinobacterium sp. 17J80-10]|uniref:hypothetical protein n=1 Tax=Janthinobacterium sp. 17J80-10 TaxID=2497863 RepID=UPI0013E8DA8B|nr:hypothetical protein [Janthinobacterium sp. 17J80-10]
MLTACGGVAGVKVISEDFLESDRVFAGFVIASVSLITTRHQDTENRQHRGDGISTWTGWRGRGGSQQVPICCVNAVYSRVKSGMRYDHRIQEWFKQTGRSCQLMAECEKNAVAHYVSL